MAIQKLPSGHYQVKLRATDGKWLTKAFPTKEEAKAFESRLKHEKHEGNPVTNLSRHLTVDEFFEDWFRAVELSASPGWRKCQRQFYTAYIQPILGMRKLKTVTPILIGRVLNGMIERGRSEQTRLHVFNLMKKMFRDAIELYQLMTHNPVLRTLKPKVSLKEAKHLNNIEAIRTRLQAAGASAWSRRR